ncbi:MAG: hypothetical protein ABIJ50_06655 [Pseudomonadota bacterium]
MREEGERDLNLFIEQWAEMPGKNREIFLHFRKYLGDKEGVMLDFISRPGLTYSLRAVHANQKKKGLFVMVDVIEDVTRWLSVCFYSDMITDPEEKGDFVPGGLLGENALCFDIEAQDDALIHYLECRMDEACRAAARE